MCIPCRTLIAHVTQQNWALRVAEVLDKPSLHLVAVCIMHAPLGQARALWTVSLKML
jgi:hypothetical protein